VDDQTYVLSTYYHIVLVIIFVVDFLSYVTTKFLNSVVLNNKYEINNSLCCQCLSRHYVMPKCLASALQHILICIHRQWLEACVSLLVG